MEDFFETNADYLVLIAVSVVVETMKQLEAQLMMRNYEGFIR